MIASTNGTGMNHRVKAGISTQLCHEFLSVRESACTAHIYLFFFVETANHIHIDHELYVLQGHWRIFNKKLAAQETLFFGSKGNKNDTSF